MRYSVLLVPILLHTSLACIPVIPCEELTTTVPPEPTTTDPPPPDPCTLCAPPPVFACDLEGYDCPGATADFTITIGDCAVLTCPDDNLLADNVPVTALTCNGDGAWYYDDGMGATVMAASALCVSPCTECTAIPIPDEMTFPPPKGSIYEPATLDDTTLPCPSMTCAVGTLVGVRECEKTLVDPLTCNGQAMWVSGGLVYPSAACKVRCDNCAPPEGYTTFGSAVTAHTPIIFNNYEFACATVGTNCPAGYALRITKDDGSEEIIAAQYVPTVMWTCLNAVWSIAYTNNAGVESTATVTNSECISGVCVSCGPPMLAAGISGVPYFDPTTGCLRYTLSGCPDPAQYRANGQDFGAGVNEIRCANVPAGDAHAGWYGANYGAAMVWMAEKDAIGCDYNPPGPCDNCDTTQAGYADWPAVVSAYNLLTFGAGASCTEAASTCDPGYGLRVTKADGTEEWIVPQYAPTVMWSCNAGAWTITYINNAGMATSAVVTNSECFTGVCISCATPMLATGVTAVASFNPNTGCVNYELFGCAGMYSVNGQDFGAGVNLLRCANVASSTSAHAGTYGANSGANMVWVNPAIDIVTCHNTGCASCPLPPVFTCNLVGYDCATAASNFVITTTDCSVLTCPNDNLLADAVPVTALTCNAGTWYYNDDMGAAVPVTSALCVSMCTNCAAIAIPDPAVFPAPQGYVYQPAVLNTATSPCPSMQCATGTLVGVNAGEVILNAGLTCNGNAQWVSSGVIYARAACKIPCNNCPVQTPGYGDWPSSVSAHNILSFTTVNQCMQAANPCGNGYAMRFTRIDGSQGYIIPQYVSSVVWTCTNGVWSISYVNNVGVPSTATVINSECFTGVCISCGTPMLAAGITAVGSINPATGCLNYELSGCAAPAQYRANGQDFGAGVNLIRCANLPVTDIHAGYYGANYGDAMVWMKSDDAIGCHDITCKSCTAPPVSACNLNGYDCVGATSNFIITGGDCLTLTCPNNNLLADLMPVPSLNCMADGSWYYTNTAGATIKDTSAICVSPCTGCTTAIGLPTIAAPVGYVYQAATFSPAATPCPTMQCATGTLVGVNAGEVSLTAPLACNGNGQWASNRVVYSAAACRIPCINCPAQFGYTDWSTVISSHYVISFTTVNQCSQAASTCGVGYGLRITKTDGTQEYIIPEYAQTVTWTCLNGVWSISYTNNAGAPSTATVSNSECFTGVCISCGPPMVVNGLTAVGSINPATGCLNYVLSGCAAPGQYRANGQDFGPGVNVIRCAEVIAGDPHAGYYGANSGAAMVWFNNEDAIGCHANPCNGCGAIPAPAVAAPLGYVYRAATFNGATNPCPTMQCATGTLVGVNAGEVTLVATLMCNGNGQWASNGVVYATAACKIPCNNCPAQSGYFDWSSAVSAHNVITFNNVNQCMQAATTCGVGYGLRITKSDGTQEYIIPQYAPTVTWSCMNGVWSISYTNNAGVPTTATVTNSECYTGVCISCGPPLLVNGITAVGNINTTTGCLNYNLYGCNPPNQYRAAGMYFGAGVNLLRCANLPPTDPHAGYYGANYGAVVWVSPADAIGCAVVQGDSPLFRYRGWLGSSDYDDNNVL